MAFDASIWCQDRLLLDKNQGFVNDSNRKSELFMCACEKLLVIDHD